MAVAASTALSSATVSSAAVTFSSKSCRTTAQKRVNGVVYLGGLNSYGGLKAHNKVISLGLPVCTEQCFTNVVNAIKAGSKKGRGGGGGLSATCNDAEEIFKIAAIMNGLVLIGVAVGFVLLRIEASLEEEADKL
ncbi:hypothetical protein Ancab_028901 [Ancistrocladus abbreviatus]